MYACRNIVIENFNRSRYIELSKNRSVKKGLLKTEIFIIQEQSIKAILSFGGLGFLGDYNFE